MKNLKKIIVCATQRSGSTMVCEDIAAYGLGKPEERFLSWILDEEDDDQDWERALETVISQGSSENGIFSVKLMANQIKNVDDCLSTFVETEAYDQPVENRNPVFPALKSVFGDGQWVWIKRRDVIDQAISHHFARQSGIYHVIKNDAGFKPGSAVTSSGYADKTSEEVPYDFQSIMKEWFSVHRDNLKWTHFFENMGIKPIEIWYEDYSGLLPQLLADRLGVAKVDAQKDRNLIKMPSEKKKLMKEQFIMDLITR